MKYQYSSVFDPSKPTAPHRKLEDKKPPTCGAFFVVLSSESLVGREPKYGLGG